jgi:transcription elongation GreA/GreB family factor
MQQKDWINYKLRLREKCISLIQSRMNGLQASMSNAQSAANEETKSSAGDKYETSRAMGQLEKDMFARQLSQTASEMAAAMSVDCSSICDSIQPGAIVICSSVKIFIFTGIGKLEFENESLIIISPNAPLAQLLFTKTLGDKIVFNQKEIQLLAVY